MAKILAIDSASCLGWAVGKSDGNPRCGFVHLGGENATPAGRFAGAIKWMNAMMKEEEPDIVAIEAPFISAENTSMSQVRLSHGLMGCLMGMAQIHRCFRVMELNVNQVQAYFIHRPPQAKGVKRKSLDTTQKKLLVRKRCIELGWTTEEDTNLDMTDACALWAYAVGMKDQPNSIRFSPLFTQQGL